MFLINRRIDGMLFECGIKGSEFSFKRKRNEADDSIQSYFSNEGKTYKKKLVSCISLSDKPRVYK